ncbi:CRISPR-associated endonuclease Cas1 [Agathobacter rectalis]|jgi:CRISPR-associated protein Cas1|uniref:CRISPR-associated endonuclease Cas1 n=1 Tax=Agathobacter rectalis TaxID=39491 RepID=A0A395UYG0_9FIRM|nr:CRISPR-associated endonuclease Cas1 [Agathobacter rectalis]RGR54906.1 CRISPR-associated endonuclease Cas1 [Agathobacter rectalis]RGT77891.1 CRISPR-associated endonuclease Cas1 [Agathobacter rectalis]RGT83197.1 CRISPR-associated endonuclease Cas1 [Agathobacter rectalis]
MYFKDEDFEKSIKILHQKKNSCGIDNVFINQFDEFWQFNKDTIISQINSNAYKPSAVMLEEIVTKTGKKRLISRYTCTDRVILDILKRRLVPIFDKTFSDYSYAYRENKGVYEAVKNAAKLIESGKKYVAEIDIKDFFENINLQRLEHYLALKISDKDMNQLLHRYLYIFTVVDDKKTRKTQGIIQGSSLSPLFSNVYMADFDKYLESKYSFCRFSDNINIYCASEEEAYKAFNDVTHWLQGKLGLKYNHDKSGVYPSLDRRYLGYDFKWQRGTNTVSVCRHNYEKPNYFGSWHCSAIQKIDRNYHIINDGVLNKKDFTILIENDEHKMYIPIETCTSINIYSNVILGSSFLQFINSRGLNVNIFDKYGNFIGSFHSEHHYKRSVTLLKQASIYNDERVRLMICVKIETASLHNQRENLRYFNKHRPSGTLKSAIEYMSNCIVEMKQSKSVNQLLTIEARAKQKYLQTFDEMISDDRFKFDKRTRRPPLNEVNAMISFGNTFIYRRIANEIYRTALDIRIGFVHAANSRSESLNLDIAEIFKPIIVDRTIFTVIHNLQINNRDHFEKEDNGGIYLNNAGKRIFIRELEYKLSSKISIDGQKLTYDKLMKAEVYKIVKFVQDNEKYKPFKYT